MNFDNSAVQIAKWAHEAFDIKKSSTIFDVFDSNYRRKNNCRNSMERVKNSHKSNINAGAPKSVCDYSLEIICRSFDSRKSKRVAVLCK